jgi:hypothetical protein
MGDGTSRNGGLVSWASWKNDPARLGKIEGYLGKNITKASDAEQIKAMKWEMENDYPGAYRTFMNPNSSAKELKQASKAYWGYGHEGQRFTYATQAMEGLQKGGVVGMKGTSSGSSQRFEQAQMKFADRIAEGVQPIVIPMPSGGGGAKVVRNSSSQTTPPSLPAGPSSLQAAEYLYRLNMANAF